MEYSDRKLQHRTQPTDVMGRSQGRENWTPLYLLQSTPNVIKVAVVWDLLCAGYCRGSGMEKNGIFFFFFGQRFTLPVLASLPFSF